MQVQILKYTMSFLQRVFTSGESGEDAVFQPIGGSAHQSQLHVSHGGVFSFLLLHVFLSIFRSSQVLLDVTSISQESGEVRERSRSCDASLHHAPLADWQAAQPVTVTLGETARPLALPTGQETRGLHVSISIPLGPETDSPSFSSRQEASERSQGRAAPESVGWVAIACLMYLLLWVCFETRRNAFAAHLTSVF